MATVATNQAIITEAFQILGVVREGRQPTPTQSSNGLTILNDNLATQNRDGWGNIGWWPQTVAMLNNLAPLQDAEIAFRTFQVPFIHAPLRRADLAALRGR